MFCSVFPDVQLRDITGHAGACKPRPQYDLDAGTPNEVTLCPPGRYSDASSTEDASVASRH
jgi:hypothetical protein